MPIKPIDRHEDNFGHLQADLIGPMGNGKYKYALVLTDVQSRFVNAFELTAPTASNVFDKLMIHCSIFGLPRYISFDGGTQFTSDKLQHLTEVQRLELLKLSDEFASCSSLVVLLWDPGGIVQTDVCFECIWMELCEVIQRGRFIQFHYSCGCKKWLLAVKCMRI